MYFEIFLKFYENLIQFCMLFLQNNDIKNVTLF